MQAVIEYAMPYREIVIHSICSSSYLAQNIIFFTCITVLHNQLTTYINKSCNTAHTLRAVLVLLSCGHYVALMLILLI